MMKIVSAAAMLAVSASMLGTSTYAWFSMNKTVTATGISLTATGPQQLLIKGSAAGAIYKSAIAFTNSADSAVYDSAALDNMYPVAYKTRSANSADPNDTFKKLTATGMVKVDNDGRVAGADVVMNGTDVTAATSNTDYFFDNFTLKYAGEFNSYVSQTQLTISFADGDTTNNASNIVGALHVVLVDDKDTANVYEYDMSNATAGTGADAGTYTLAASNITAFSATNEEIKYDVYVFYDGEDADCKNSNAVNMDDYTFTFDFELLDTTPNP